MPFAEFITCFTCYRFMYLSYILLHHSKEYLTYLTKLCEAAVNSLGRSFSHVTTRTQDALKFVGRGLERSFLTSDVAMLNVVFAPGMESEYI